MTTNVELSRKIDTLRDIVTRTATDVTWIKEGMEKGAVRMNDHQKRIEKLEGHNQRQLGVTATISAALGGVFGAIFGHGVKF